MPTVRYIAGITAVKEEKEGITAAKEEKEAGITAVTA